MNVVENVGLIEMAYLSVSDYEELKDVMVDSYTTMPDSYWTEENIKILTSIFPEGQVALKVDGEMAGCALSIIIDKDAFDDSHTYRTITGDFKFDTHTLKGDVLYGIDVFIHPKFRGMRLGRRMYDYRKELCERLNLSGIYFGGRLPNYHKHAEVCSPKEYIERVKNKEIHDPVLNFQLSNDFHVKKIMKDYLEDDKASQGYAALMEWVNVYYSKPKKKANTQKSVVRLGLVQWQMRPYKDISELMEQVDYFIDAVSAYRCDFVMFPEFFNAPLMAAYNDFSTSDSIRELAKFTKPLRDKFVALAVNYNINIVAGSLPEMQEDGLYNVGYLCKRDGSYEKYEKIHVTPDEAKVWGLKGGTEIKTFNTDCGKIGVLICYDVEFPELSRIMALEGMNILFVPFLTDTQNGYSRVRHCAQARAIENECYVAIAGSVGNLPKVHNMDIQFAQSVVFTPCDFAFPTNGVKAEATANTEMILVADVDIDLLKELHQFGAVKNLKDRRTDLYCVSRVKS